jgi:hypothetical protein
MTATLLKVEICKSPHMDNALVKKEEAVRFDQHAVSGKNRKFDNFI